MLEQFLGACVVYPWDKNAAAAYGTLPARQERLGQKSGPYDMQMAAHAVALGAVLVSRDHALRRILSLQVENWATDVPDVRDAPASAQDVCSRHRRITDAVREVLSFRTSLALNVTLALLRIVGQP